MLKTSLIRIVLRVAFTTLVTSNLTLKLAAHDHFESHWPNEHIKTSCFVSDLPVAPKVASETNTWKHSLASSYHMLHSGLSQLQDAWKDVQPLELVSKLAEQIPTQPDEPQLELIVHKPLNGVAPCPKAKPLQLNYLYATYVGNWDEPYLPYELAAKDRHFGTRLELSAIRDSKPEVSSESDFAPAHRQDLVSQAVAFATELFLDPRWVRFTQQVEVQVEAVIASLQSHGLRAVEGWSAPMARKPYLEQPSFVFFELEDGQQLLLKVEDALRWSFFQEQKSVSVNSAASEDDLLIALTKFISRVNADLKEMAGFSIQQLKGGWSNVRDNIESWSAGLKALSDQMRMATQVRYYRGTRCLR